MSENRRATIGEFVRWRCRQRDSLPIVLAESARVDDRGLVFSGSDFIEAVAALGGMDELEIIYLIDDQEGGLAAVVFEARDTVTLLRHRVSCWLQFQDGEVTRIVEVSSVVQAGQHI